MILYRLIRARYLESAWNGYGAKLYGGRWNSVGKAAVYVATSVSLAVLEILVQIGDDEILSDFTLLSIDIPDEHIDILNTAVLPYGWNAPVPPIVTAEIGNEWLSANNAAGLMLPSAVIPSEYNVMLNPAVEDFHLYLNSVKHLDFGFDQRLFKHRTA